MPFTVVHPVESNGVSSRWTSRASNRLNAAGWFVYRFIDGRVRFMCSWATTAEAVEELGAALKSLA